MRTAAGLLGRHLYAITDGETGERSGWIGWQLGKLLALDGVEMRGTHAAAHVDNPDYAEFPALSVASSVTELPPRWLGYADAAEQSYPIYQRLRAEGAIPDEVKFQVSIPTPFASVVTWVRDEDQEPFFRVYAAAIDREIKDIASIVGDDLVLQYDVAVEFGALTLQLPAAGGLGNREAVLGTLQDLISRSPSGVPRGVHLCYGDYKHRHFTVPQDLSLCVEVAGAVADRVDFVHMPADRDTGRDPGYFEPLRDLRVKRLALGVIDYDGDEQRTNELIEAASTGSGGMEFAVATECGMARIDERGPGGPSLEQLLELHARAAAPLR
ncbi:MAG: hypothetical protein JOY89_26745 [Solirubrobacterales bacterium]|nr:hypothetical protein [Solirubrobacterales bacterium]